MEIRVRRSGSPFGAERTCDAIDALTAAGLQVGSKVASYLYNSNEYVEGLLGTFKLRAVPVNVNYRYQVEELAYLVDNADLEGFVLLPLLGVTLTF